MGLVIHMHQSLAISQTATWSTVNVISNTLMLPALSDLQSSSSKCTGWCGLSLQLCPPPVPLNTARERTGIMPSVGECKAHFGHTDV